MKQTLYNCLLFFSQTYGNKEKTSALNRALKPVSTQYSLMVKQKSALCIYLLHKNSCYRNTSICELLELMSVECESLQTVDKLIHEQNKCLIIYTLICQQVTKIFLKTMNTAYRLFVQMKWKTKLMNDRVPYNYLVPQ